MEKQDIRTDFLILFFQDPVSHISERRRRQQKSTMTKRSDAGCSEVVRILAYDCPADSWRISGRESSSKVPWQARKFLEGSTLPISIIYATALLHDEAIITLDAVVLQQAGEICSDRETTPAYGWIQDQSGTSRIDGLLITAPWCSKSDEHRYARWPQIIRF